MCACVRTAYVARRSSPVADSRGHAPRKSLLVRYAHGRLVLLPAPGCARDGSSVDPRCDVTRNRPRAPQHRAGRSTRHQSLTAVAVSGGSWQPRPRGPGDHRERRARRLGTLGGGGRRGLGKAPGAHVLVPTDGVTRPRALWIVERCVLSTR